MNDYDFAVCALEMLAKHLEAWEPDRFSKETIVTFVRRAMGVVAEICHDDDPEAAYEQQLQFCAKHGLLCFEYYRRHGVPKRQRVKSWLVKGGEADESNLSYPRCERQQ